MENLGALHGGNQAISLQGVPPEGAEEERGTEPETQHACLCLCALLPSPSTLMLPCLKLQGSGPSDRPLCHQSSHRSLDLCRGSAGG